MKKILCLLVLVMLLATTPSFAEEGKELTGMDALRGAKNAIVFSENPENLDLKELSDALYWLGYIQAMSDTVVLICDTYKLPRPYEIPPEGFQNEQVVRVIHKYLSEHPEELHQTARACILMALCKMFPRKQ